MKDDQNNIDVQLIKKTQEGDHSAFNQIVDRYKRKITDFVCKFLGDRDEAKDVVQEIFIKVYIHSRKFKEKFRFSTWIFTIAKNESINRIKHLRKGRTCSIDEEIEIEGNKLDRQFIDNNAVQADEKLAREEVIKQAEIVIDSLPDVYRLAFVLSRFQNLSDEEVAKIMRCNISTVRTRLFRAKEMLREKLRKYLE